MSSRENIAAVTFVFSQLLQQAASQAVSGATVTTGRPDTTENGASGPRINVFLYGVNPNSAWRNAELPTRRPDGTLVQRPQVALDLHYLLTFYGEESTLDDQRLLGSAVSALHEKPLLSRQRIQDTIDAVTDPTIGGDPAHFLADADLAEQVEIVRFSPLSLNLEELSKLWSVFFQVPYALSIAYQASVVLIEADETPPQRALPVRQPEIIMRTFRRIVIDRIISQDGADQPIHADSTLLVLGQQLRDEHTEVRIAGQPVPPEALDVSNTQIRVPLAAIAASLQAGVLGLQVVHPLSTERPHLRFESPVTPFVLRPRIDGNISFDPEGESDEPEVGMNVEPAVRASQRVVLLLNELTNEAPNAYVIEVSVPADSNQISIPVPGVEPGAYLVRIQVDGAESILEVDADPNSPTRNQYIGPTVTVP